MSDRLLGAHEAAELLGLTRQALHHRRRQDDFPQPVATVKATPLWTREQLVAYAQDRASRYFEQPGIERLASVEQVNA